jgi:hypothetical protein
MDRVYVCASKFLIFNFVGSELAETDGVVADLRAWDNIGCRPEQSLIFLRRFSFFGLEMLKPGKRKHTIDSTIEI